MEKQYKKMYQLKVKDFIPIIGVRNHSKRGIKEVDECSNPILKEEYSSKWFTREMILLTYNALLVSGAGVAITGLEQLLTK